MRSLPFIESTLCLDPDEWLQPDDAGEVLAKTPSPFTSAQTGTLLALRRGLPDQSAFALGQDLARIVGPAHLTVIESFLAAVSIEASSSNVVLARSFGTSDGTAVAAARLQAFRAGLRLAG